MRFFIDTEFTSDDPARLQLISIALVGEDGSSFYAISNEFDRGGCSDFVVEHVVPLLEPEGGAEWMSRAQIARGIEQFLARRASELWGYSPAYDWYLLHGLYGGWGKIPESFPWHCWDLRQWAWQLGADDLPEQQSREHHALDDARHDVEVFRHLLGIAPARGWPAPAP